jgi:hypothetical protein
MGKKGKSSSQSQVEDLALLTARKENERLASEELKEINARAKKLEAPQLHST